MRLNYETVRQSIVDGQQALQRSFMSRGSWDQEEPTCDGGKMVEACPLFLKVAIQEHTFDVQQYAENLATSGH